MKLMFQMYYDKYIDSHSSLCIGSKSSLAVVHQVQLQITRVKIQLSKLENASGESITTPSWQEEQYRDR